MKLHRSKEELILHKLDELLSEDAGYFGRVYTWRNKKTKYEKIGYVLSEPFAETLEKMSHTQVQKLVKILFYFEIHARPLSRLIQVEEGNNNLFSEIAWSHFMTVIMFGMLEVAVVDTSCAKYHGNRYIKKLESIKCFLECNLSDERKKGIANRYRAGDDKKIIFEQFGDVITHMWEEIRSGFVHEAGLESKGLEWSFLRGEGTSSNPFVIESDVPMQEFLQVTWQGILNSFGYKGQLKLAECTSWE